MNKRIIVIFMIMLMIVNIFGIINASAELILDQQQTSDGGAAWFVYYNNYVAQSFKPTLPILSRVYLKCGAFFDPYNYLKLSIRSSLNGNDLAYVIAYQQDMPQEDWDWHLFDLEDIDVIPGEEYFIVLTTFTTDENYYVWAMSEKYHNHYTRGKGYVYKSGSWQCLETYTSGDWYDFCFKTYGHHPPNTPNNPDPYDGETGVDVNHDLSWDCSDPDGDSLTYDVYFGTSSYPPLVSSGQTSTTYDPGQMNSLTTYYWKIKAKDEHGEKTTGPIWDFTTKNNPPNPPSNPSPPDGATGVNVNADLSWTCSDPDGDSLTYDVYFGISSPPLYKTTTTQQTYDPGTMNYNTEYYWKIKATDENGESTIGPIWDFTTNDEPINPPSVTTNDPSFSNICAILGGTLDSLGGADSCQVWFVFDDESHDDWQDYDGSSNPETKNSPGSFIYLLLMNQDTHYYRAVASNSAGTVQGEEKVFTDTTLSLDPDPLNFGEMLEGKTATKTFEIWNSGDGFLNYEFDWTAEWITDVTPTSGTSNGEHDEITVTIDTTGLTLGVKTEFIAITCSNLQQYNYPVNVKIVYNFAPPNATLNISDIDFLKLTKNPIINDLYLNEWSTIPDDMSSASYGFYGYEANTETGFERAAIKARYDSIISLIPEWVGCEAHLRATYTVPVTTSPGVSHYAEVSLAGNCKGWVWIENIGGSNADVDIIIREGTSETYPYEQWAIGYKNLKKYEVGAFLNQDDSKFNYDFTHYKDKVRVCLDEGKTYSFWVSVKTNLLLEGFEFLGWKYYGQGWSDIQFQFDSIQIKYRNPPISPPEGENLPEITNHYGPKNLILGEQGSFTARANDTDGDQLYYKWYWGDGTETEWLGPYESDQTVDKEHTYETPGNYFVRTQTKENTEFELLSNITEPLEVFVFRPEGEIIVDKPAAGDKVQYVQREPILFPIEWQKSGFTGDKVDIALYKGNGNGNYEFIRHIFKNFPNDGSCNWKPQPSDGYGNDFRVVIYNGINAANASGRFTILKPRSKIREIFLEKIISLIREMPLFQKLIDIVTRINNILETK